MALMSLIPVLLIALLVALFDLIHLGRRIEALERRKDAEGGKRD